MTDPSPTLQRVLQAMESLYGRFTAVSNANKWNPPPRAGGHRGRYLWTDAFGVLNFITLHHEHRKASLLAPTSTLPSATAQSTASAKEGRYLAFARRLVDTVHNILGRTRDGSQRLPGASDTNPLGGGLRIGKIDATGPDADGQYHHYLTLWMFALNRLSLATGDPTYNAQAVALAKAIHPVFVRDRDSDAPRMVWKMDMDLSAPLVASEGNLDPLDGWVVFRIVQALAVQMGQGAVLESEIGDYERVLRRKGRHVVSRDPLDLGMTLWTVHWFVGKEEWATALSERCFDQIHDLVEVDRYFEQDTRYRLAFREFGTCLGIQCISEEASEKERAVDLKSYANILLESWKVRMDRTLSMDFTTDDLRPITRVMYAAALLPGAFRQGYLGPEPVIKPEG